MAIPAHSKRSVIHRRPPRRCDAARCFIRIEFASAFSPGDVGEGSRETANDAPTSRDIDAVTARPARGPSTRRAPGRKCVGEATEMVGGIVAGSIGPALLSGCATPSRRKQSIQAGVDCPETIHRWSFRGPTIVAPRRTPWPGCRADDKAIVVDFRSFTRMKIPAPSAIRRRGFTRMKMLVDWLARGATRHAVRGRSWGVPPAGQGDRRVGARAWQISTRGAMRRRGLGLVGNDGWFRGGSGVDFSAVCSRRAKPT